MSILVKNRKFFPPHVFSAPAEEVFLGIGYRRWVQKTRMMGLSVQEISLTISSAV